MKDSDRAVRDHYNKMPRPLGESMAYDNMRHVLEQEERRKAAREARKTPEQRERQRTIEGILVCVLVLVAVGWWLADRFALGARSGVWLESYIATQTWVGSYYGAVAKPLTFAFTVNEVVEGAARATPAISGAADTLAVAAACLYLVIVLVALYAVVWRYKPVRLIALAMVLAPLFAGAMWHAWRM